jgi:hypothetical protein
MSSQGAAKVSVSLPADLAEQVRKHIRGRGLSAFAARAMRHELERDFLGSYLEDLEERLGPVDEALVAKIDRVWLDT